KLYLTKETFSFDVGKALDPFLYAIARNLAIAAWRSRKIDSGALLSFDSLEEDLASALRARMEASAPPVPDETMTDLWLCIWSLSETEQTYLLLCGKHGLGELSHNEIGEVLGKRHATEITRISQRALDNLRTCMVSKGYGRNLAPAAKEGTGCSR